MLVLLLMLCVMGWACHVRNCQECVGVHAYGVEPVVHDQDVPVQASRLKGVVMNCRECQHITEELERDFADYYMVSGTSCNDCANWSHDMLIFARKP